MAEKMGNPQMPLPAGNQGQMPPPPYMPIDPPPAYTQQPYPGEGFAFTGRYPPQQFPGYQGVPVHVAPAPGVGGSHKDNDAHVVTVMKIGHWGPFPMQISCPQCQARVMTETTASPGLLTWLLSGALVFIGCWLGCCLIPCCIPECQDIEHSCPNCKAHLGTFRRI